MDGGSTGGLFDREAELARLDAHLDRARRGEGGIVLLEAPAGLGKSRLLAAARQRSEQRGMLVLSARAQPLERDLACGLLRQALDSVVRRRSDDVQTLFDGLSAPAGALFQAPDEWTSQSEPALFYGLYWLLVRLADERPLALLLDDLHWADAPSLRFLTFLLPRLQDVAAAVVGAARPREPGAEAELLAGIAADPAVETLRPPPLSAESAARLVSAQMGSEADDAFCTACHRASAGNPFLITELVRELVAQAVAPTARAAGRVPSIGPAGVARSVSVRLDRLPPGALAVAQSAAVLGNEADLPGASVLARLGAVEAAEVADALVAADILERGDRLTFVHPLIRQAVYDGIAPHRRAALHRAAAGMLADGGSEPDRIASHLLSADPAHDPRSVEVLRAAARSALARAAPATAATYLERALREPPPPESRLDLLLELGGAELAAGDPAGDAHLAEVVARTGEPAQLAHAAVARGRLLLGMGRLPESIEMLRAATGKLERSDVELARRVEAELLAIARWSPDDRAMVVRRLEAVALDVPAAPSVGMRCILAVLAQEATFTNRPATLAVELAQRALCDGRLLEEERAESAAHEYARDALVFAGDLDRAEQEAGAALAYSRAHGSVAGMLAATFTRLLALHQRGSVAELEVEARLALRVIDTAVEALRPQVTVMLVEALRERGEAESGREELERAWRSAAISGDVMVFFLLWARGRLRLDLGDAAGASGDLLESGRLQADLGILSPSVTPWRSPAALALARQGQDGRARDLALEELDLARGFGAPRTIGVALRGLGLVRGGDEGIELLEQAVEVLEGSSARLEHSRALVDLGAALRRSNRPVGARPRLSQAIDLALTCGARALVERAHHELRSAGGRPRRLRRTGVEALTPTEGRIARMAADGLSNPAIAQALFVTRKNVEMHLVHAYQKLGVSSRQQLAEILEPARQTA